MFVLGSTAISGQTILDVVSLEQDQGLHEREVNHVVRDNAGYFYLFMNDAIQRFNGEYFEAVNHQILKEVKFKPSDISRVDLLNDGSIHLRMSNENKSYCILKGARNVSKSKSEEKTLVSEGILYKQNTKEGSYEIKAVSSNEVITTVNKDVSEIIFSEKGTYFTDTENSLYYQDGQGSTSEVGATGNIIKRDNEILLWTEDKIYSVKGKNLTEIASLPDTTMWLTRLKKDGVGNVIASYSMQDRFNDHLFILSKNNELTDHTNLVNEGRRIFKDFWTDDASYKWMIVGYNALKIVSLLRDGAYVYQKNYKTKKGEFGMVICGVAADNDGNVLYLREKEGVFKIEGDRAYSKALSPVNVNKDMYNNGKIFYSKYDDKYYSYAYRYDGTTDIFQIDLKGKKYVKRTVPFKLNDLLPLSQNKILLGGYEKIGEPRTKGKMVTYNFEDGKLIIKRDKLPVVRSLYYHEQSTEYWVGTSRGVYITDQNFDDIAMLNARKESSTGQYISNEWVVMVQPYRDVMVIGTLGGAYLINPKSYKIVKHFNEENELSNDKTIGLIPDDLGNFWITTFNGVNVIDSTFRIIKKIYDHQGLSDREFNSKAIAKDTKGRIYGGTLNGVTAFDPEKVLEWNETYGIDVKEINVFNSINSFPVEYNDDINIYSSADSVVIQYTLPDYYKYSFTSDNTKVVCNSDKVDIKHENGKIVLTNLEPGDLRLSLTNGITARELSIDITCKRDWRNLLLLLGLLAALGLLTYLLIRYNAKKAEEKAKLSSKISDLQLSSLQAQMNPHFIFNALGAIQYFIQTHDAEKADEYLSNFALLMRGILESSKSKYITVKKEIETLKLYTGLEAIRFENIFDYEIEIDKDVDKDLNIPPMIIQPYVENAINHGLFNLKNRRGKLLIKLEMQDEDTLRITIEDNGVGRKKATELRTKRHKSRGMQLIEDRIDTINDAADVKVNVKIIDLEENGIAMGTKVIATISELT